MELWPLWERRNSVSLVRVCHLCDFRQRPCAGPCECRAEPDKPVDIIERAKSGYCPKGFFTAPAMRQPERIDMTPEEATRQVKAGGCCDPPKLNESIPSLEFPAAEKVV